MNKKDESQIETKLLIMLLYTFMLFAILGDRNGLFKWLYTATFLPD